MTSFRTERDSLGEVKVPETALWGAQTQRALDNFNISGQAMPADFIRALALIKASAAEANAKLGLLDSDLALCIRDAALEIADGQHAEHFPVDVFQTGSGTSSNMNANEVIARLASSRLGGRGMRVHPNDHVNMGQSSNDVVPTALHLAAAMELHKSLVPALRHLHKVIDRKGRSLSKVCKTGRTHLMDAMPLRLDQELGGWAAQIQFGIDRIQSSLPRLQNLALGGTAVGTGVNAAPRFAEHVARGLSRRTRIRFVEAPNHFEAQSCVDASVEMSGQLKTVAVSLMKIANDIRFLASGPRSGLGELSLPANEPGSSIMPGKVNPTQSEALLMVSMQVIGHDTANAMAGSWGNLQLNAMRPVIAANVLHSIRILADGCASFRENAIEGTTLDEQRIEQHLEQSLMLVTALVPEIGYMDAAHIAEAAAKNGTTLREEAIASGKISEEDYDRIVQPRTMIGNGLAGA